MKCPLSSTTGPNTPASPKATAIETVRVVPGTDVPRVRETSPAPIPRLSSEGPARLIPHPSADDHHETGCESDARPDPPRTRLHSPYQNGELWHGPTPSTTTLTYETSSTKPLPASNTPWT